MSYFLYEYAWFAHVACILKQVNKEILGRHKAHGRFSLLCKNNTDETRALVQRNSNYISWSDKLRFKFLLYSFSILSIV